MSSTTGAYSKPEEFEDKTTPAQKWYDPEIRNRMDEQAREFYTVYTGLSGGEELVEHLHRSRTLAWSIAPWPYIGQWGFLTPRIRLMPSLDLILSSLAAGNLHLDLGCGLGQDLRYLAWRGAPTENMFASDLVGEFWDAGMEMFRDRGRFGGRFVRANLLEEEGVEGICGDRDGHGGLGLRGKVQTVYMGGFLHVFGREEQLRALRVVAGVSRVGTRVSGFQWGMDRTRAGEEVLKDKRSEALHDEETMVRLWQRLGELEGMRWRVEATVHPMGEFYPQERDYKWMGEGAGVVLFEAVREA